MASACAATLGPCCTAGRPSWVGRLVGVGRRADDRKDVKPLEDLDAILDVPGVDMVQFGPADYAMSMGLSRLEDAEQIREAEEHVIAAHCATEWRPGPRSPTPAAPGTTWSWACAISVSATTWASFTTGSANRVPVCGPYWGTCRPGASRARAPLQTNQSLLKTNQSLTDKEKGRTGGKQAVGRGPAQGRSAGHVVAVVAVPGRRADQVSRGRRHRHRPVPVRRRDPFLPAAPYRPGSHRPGDLRPLGPAGQPQPRGPSRPRLDRGVHEPPGHRVRGPTSGRRQGAGHRGEPVPGHGCRAGHGRRGRGH